MFIDMFIDANLSGLPRMCSLHDRHLSTIATSLCACSNANNNCACAKKHRSFTTHVTSKRRQFHRKQSKTASNFKYCVLRHHFVSNFVTSHVNSLQVLREHCLFPTPDNLIWYRCLNGIYGKDEEVTTFSNLHVPLYL